MNLIDLYKHRISVNNLDFNLQQLCIINTMQKIRDELLSKKFLKFNKPKGLYLWGPVGRGKTFLIDLFVESLENFPKKARLHFHEFMQDLHKKLLLLEGQRDPLKYYIKTLAKKTKILFLDEFLVEDITDAMLLYRLLLYLKKYKIILITTSNYAPDSLYLNGLQRESFLPAIELLVKNNFVLELAGVVDYREESYGHKELYHYHILKEKKSLLEMFKNTGKHKKNKKIIVNNRSIKIILALENILFIKFSELCQTNRHKSDYFELIKIYKIFIITDIPKLNDNNINALKRFINLIDILYDHGIQILLDFKNPHVNINSLYTGNKIDFTRTLSRLKQMPS